MKNNNQHQKARTAVRSDPQHQKVRKNGGSSEIGPMTKDRPKPRSYSIQANLTGDSWNAHLKWGRRSSTSSGPSQVITQKEVITDVFGSSSYSVTEWRIQPGSATTFPWAAAIAQKYQKYDIVRLVARFKPTVSGFAPDGQQGRVTLCADYDSSNPAPNAMNQAMDLKPSVSGMAATPLSLTLDPDLLNQGGRYICDKIPSGTDPKTYDAGYLYFAVDGTTSSGKIGELVLEYTIALFNPVLLTLTTLPRNLIRSAATRVTNLAFGATGVWTDVTGLALNNNAAGQNPLGLTMTGDFIVFPVGYYNVTISFGGYVASGYFSAFGIRTVSGGGVASTEQFTTIHTSTNISELRDQLSFFWAPTSSDDSFKVQMYGVYPTTVPNLTYCLVSALAA